MGESRHELRFKVGQAFPASEPVSRFSAVLCMALNDLVLASDHGVREGLPNWEYFYFLRLTAAHFFEAEKFIRESSARYPEIDAFICGLGDEANENWCKVRDVAADQSVKRLRDVFFHYPEMLDRTKSQYDQFTRALAGLSEQDGRIIQGKALKDLRCEFADDVAARLTRGDQQLPGEGARDVVVDDLVASLRDGVIALQDFSFTCVQAYLKALPKWSSP